MRERINVGIDASRSKSGGGVSHIKGILRNYDNERFIFDEVHLWAYEKLLSQLPNYPWLITHNPKEIEKGLLSQLLWQRLKLPSELKKNNCVILLNTDAGSVSTFSPCVTMSRDMLSYEPGELESFKFSKIKIRNIILKYIQNISLRRATSVLFLTKYAASVIMRSTGTLQNYAIVNHGLSDVFRTSRNGKGLTKQPDKTIQCIYISPIFEYKHQWNVIKAIHNLRNEGYNLSLTLVGGGTGPSRNRVEEELNKCDPNNEYITILDFVPQESLPLKIKNSNIFVFASSCENMPNTLIEGMASGTPIACSNRGPMPEVLEDGGTYFNPRNINEIEDAIRTILIDEKLALQLSNKSLSLSTKYTWSRCSNETFKLLEETYMNYKSRKIKCVE